MSYLVLTCISRTQSSSVYISRDSPDMVSLPPCSNLWMTRRVDMETLRKIPLTCFLEESSNILGTSNRNHARLPNAAEILSAD